MLAPKIIPQKFLDWNRRNGAPNGFQFNKRQWLRPIVSENRWLRWRGPFSIQGNSSTRAFEYPWAFSVGKLEPGMRVLEVGGGLSGFQFILARKGCEVFNVDPGMEKHGWPCNQQNISKLNQIFSTQVKLQNCGIEDLDLPSESFDRIFSISVIEHFPAKIIPAALANVYRLLKPGGLFVCTVDLFFNLYPFTDRAENEYGINQNIESLVAQSGLKMIAGNSAELNGFEGFSCENILSNLENYLIGNYPVLVQCMVLKKES